MLFEVVVTKERTKGNAVLLLLLQKVDQRIDFDGERNRSSVRKNKRKRNNKEGGRVCVMV